MARTEGEVRASLREQQEAQLRAGEAVARRARAAAEQPSAPAVDYAALRPNGKGLLTGGSILMVVGALAAGIAVVLPQYWPLIYLGGAGFQLGLILWLAGTILRAIFFLPGREVSIAELEL